MKITSTQTTVLQTAARVCPGCGVPLDGFGPEGLCPACMLRTGLEAVDAANPPEVRAFQPRWFGDYELLEEIARGGMGVIYKARQVKLNRTVALKLILSGQHAGVAELARFKAEAETAARLQHPNIVAIHEVGEHEGQPFFSMDYVAGQSLAQLVGNAPLPAHRAACYLNTIAEAVHHSHVNGVLHRDLKPSNVLVDAATDTPRVTDFGLAKRLEGDASLTMTGQVLGSPSFMSPEQAAGSQTDLVPASDVYSLGAMLYHLLTGRPPFVADTVTATLRMVAEAEPISPRLLNASVPRDVETICLKCLRKEPLHRYATAQELAEDLGRFLRDEPIHARPASTAEKAWRWCRRNRALAATGATVLLLLLTVAIGSPLAAIRIARERQQAQTNEAKAIIESARSAQVSSFMKDMLKGVAPQVAQGRDTTMLREILDGTAERALRDLSNQPEVEAELLSIISDVYEALGEGGKAESARREALQIQKRIFGDLHPAVAESLVQMCYTLWRQNRRAEAEVFGLEAVALHRKLYGNQDARTAFALVQLVNVYWRSGNLDDAETTLQEALQIERTLAGTNDTPGLAYALGQVGLVHYCRKSLVEAERWLRSAVEMYERMSDAIEIIWRMENLGQVLAEQGRQAEAEAVLSHAVKLGKQSNNNDGLVFSLRTLGRQLLKAGKLNEAETVMRENLEVMDRIYTGNHLNFNVVLTDLAETLTLQGRFADAENAYRAALSASLSRYGITNLYYAASLYKLAKFLNDQHRSPEAEPLARECIQIRKEQAAGDWLKFESQILLGCILVARKNYAEAEAALITSYESARKRTGTIPFESKMQLKENIRCLVQLFAETGRPEQAVEWSEKQVRWK